MANVTTQKETNWVANPATGAGQASVACPALAHMRDIPPNDVYTLTAETQTGRVTVKTRALTENSALFISYQELLALGYRGIEIKKLEKEDGN